MRRPTLLYQLNQHYSEERRVTSDADVDMPALWRVVDTMLTPREAEILHQLYDANGNASGLLRAVAETHDISQSRVQQIRDRAIRKLCHTKRSEHYLRKRGSQ